MCFLKKKKTSKTCSSYFWICYSCRTRWSHRFPSRTKRIFASLHPPTPNKYVLSRFYPINFVKSLFDLWWLEALPIGNEQIFNAVPGAVQCQASPEQYKQKHIRKHRGKIDNLFWMMRICQKYLLNLVNYS